MALLRRPRLRCLATNLTAQSVFVSLDPRSRDDLFLFWISLELIFPFLAGQLFYCRDFLLVGLGQSLQTSRKLTNA